MEPQCTEEQFLKNVAEHKAEIVRDDGLYRHVRYRQPGTYCMGFDLITWPGYLCFCGDMGDFVFDRIPDMFDFFRGSGHKNKQHENLSVNFGYWAEKCGATDKHGGIKEYSADKFREIVKDILDDDEEATDDLRNAIKDEVLASADEGQFAAYQAASDFRWDDKEYFSDFWEHSLEVYTFRFLWCCYAIAWGIAEYDKVKANSGNNQQEG